MAFTSLVLHQQDDDPRHFTFQTPRGDMGYVKGRIVVVEVVLGHREAGKTQIWSHVFATHLAAKQVATQMFDTKTLCTMLQRDLEG